MFCGLIYLPASSPEVGVPSADHPPQSPTVHASWEVIAADALQRNESADFPVVFPWELRFPRVFPWELRRELGKPQSLTVYF